MKISLKHPVIFGICVTLAFALLVFYLSTLSYCEPAKNGTLICQTKLQKFMKSSPNEIGDTLAGIAGSLAFLWIIVTVFLQSQELAAQRKELELGRKAAEKTNRVMDKQLFENTFFSMLNTLNAIIDSIDLVNSDTNQTTSGRDCFRVFYTRFTKIYRRAIGSEETKLDYTYSQFWKTHQSELGHYFRYLYRAFTVLSESEHTEEYHIKLLRSQLSNQELVLLFYNCVSINGSNFIPLAVKFELFDNMPAYMLLEKDHHRMIPSEAFGGNSMQKPKKQIKPKGRPS